MASLMVLALLGTRASAVPVKPDQAVINEIQGILDKRENVIATIAKSQKKLDQLEAAIGLRDDKGVLQPVDSVGLTECARRLLGLGTEKYEEYAALTRDYKSAQEELRSLSANAIQMAADAYGATPAKSSGEIVSGPPLPVTDDDVPGFIGNHPTYGPKFVARMEKGRSGFTDDAGNVLIGPEAFASPGKLAFILYHEGEHFENLLTPGLDLRNVPGEEVESRERQRSLLKDVFDFSDADVKIFDEKTAAERKDSKKWEAIIAAGYTPYKKSHQPLFPRIRVPKHLEDGLPEEVDQILSRAKELREEDERRTRERDEQRRAALAAEEAHRRVMSEYRAAAAGCGLTPIMTQGDKTLGFKADDSANVYFTEPVTLAQAKAGMVMTRACWAGMGGQAEDAPCSDSLGEMRARWTEPAFRHGLELDADAGNIDGCLRAIRESTDSPKDMKALNKQVSKYWRDWKVAAKRREMETYRELRRGQEEASRRARGDAEERSGRVPDQSYDLTPARRALEEARRSGF